MSRETDDKQFDCIRRIVESSGFYASEHGSPRSTRAAELSCCRNPNSDCIRLFVRDGHYYFLTYAPCCYEAGRDVQLAAAACIACLRSEDSISRWIPQGIVSDFRLRPMPAYEWFPLFDAAGLSTNIYDMLPQARRMAKLAASNQWPKDGDNDLIDLLWLMRDYAADGLVSRAEMKQWKAALVKVIDGLAGHADAHSNFATPKARAGLLKMVRKMEMLLGS